MLWTDNLGGGRLWGCVLTQICLELPRDSFQDGGKLVYVNESRRSYIFGIVFVLKLNYSRLIYG